MKPRVQSYVAQKLTHFRQIMGLPQPKHSAQKPFIVNKQTEKKEKKSKEYELPKSLINSSKLRQWLDEKLQNLAEYESLMTESNEKKQSAIKNLKRDIDILRSTVLQSNESKDGLRENAELKRVYIDIVKMDKELPILRRRHIEPLIAEQVKAFKECNVRKTVCAQQKIKAILKDNKFESEAKSFCKVKNGRLIKHLLFESKVNETLNDDLDLLRDFGVKCLVEVLEESDDNGLNLRLVFDAHSGINLVIFVSEARYCHFYGFMRQREPFMSFCFELAQIKNNRFGKKHIEWLELYKMKTIESNGKFVSIVNVYNFYYDAVKLLIKSASLNSAK